MRVRPLTVLLVLAAALTLAAPASASEIIARNAQSPVLKVNKKGEALISFSEAGKHKNVLAWGAVNALQPTTSRKQVSFKLDYSGGWGKYRSGSYAKMFVNSCRRYDGPVLAWKIATCKAADGSYWALQSWQRALPNLGVPAWSAKQTVWELHLSHWTGPLAQIEGYTDWVYGRKDHHLFGRFSYLGEPVHGFKATSSGVPLDSFGRNVYLDTFGSAHGPGWERENSFLSQVGSGSFCYGFFRRPVYAGYPDLPVRPKGNGSAYRITAIGPGVTPIVQWQGMGLPDFDPGNEEHRQREQDMNALQRLLAGANGQCTNN